MDCIDPKVDCILITLTSTHFHTGHHAKGRKDNGIDFLSTQSKKLKI